MTSFQNLELSHLVDSNDVNSSSSRSFAPTTYWEDEKNNVYVTDCNTDEPFKADSFHQQRAHEWLKRKEALKEN